MIQPFEFHSMIQKLHKLLLPLAAILMMSPKVAKSQNEGDTLRVKTFHYGSNTRDTVANFPKGDLSYEKIILRYSMRCKNGLISDGSNRNKGCGEWDYSCNTFLVDSSQIEVVPQTAPKFVVSNFTGTSFAYTTKPVSDYYDYGLEKVEVLSASNVLKYTIGNGKESVSQALNTTQKSGKTLMLYKAQELLDAGFSAGEIQGFSLHALQGGTANFFKIQIKQSSQNQLDHNAAETNGYTEVYRNTLEFAKGDQQIVFHTPFTWDGKSHLLVEFSFTNTSGSSAVVFEGSADTANCMMWANNNFAVDLASNGHVVIDASSLSSIKNELSIAFWALRDAKSLPTNTSVIYGWAADPNQRQLNIHFPWSDGSIYFDCGYAAGGYDRINKAAGVNDYEGQWNHWVFTKNAVTGNMLVYLNGTLWLSGGSKTKTLSLMNMILGKDQNLQNNYKGKINELSIWDKVLSATEVKAWMNRPIDNTHPQYANLVAYYPMNEGNGTSLADSAKGKISVAKNIQWTYDRGDALTRMFQVAKVKPNLGIITGSYNKTVTNIILRDSIIRPANTIDRYRVMDQSQSAVVTHDLLKLDSTFSLFQARKSMVYNGENGSLIDSIVIRSEGNIELTKLNYSLRFPWYNELVSFVTPYGINLDLGMKGKDWYFDLTDFAPLLKNKKRLMVAMGGQNQEQMEMEFLFIVGKPVRSVLAFNQLWQGGARIGGPGINGILNNAVFAPVNVPLLGNAKAFKLRSTITGHGSDGEFEQNGGPITHTMNVAGNAMSWRNVMDCSVNPMIAQGGTWLIPRQGWCPGWRSMLMEHEITQWVKPGSTETIDYEISQPTKSGGDYRYIVAHQLVSYGDLNFNLDAKIVDVIKPTADYEFSKTNPICAQPVILVQNSGKETIKILRFDYWVNNSTVKQSWQWAGELKSLDTLSITLPTWELWSHGMLPSNNVFHCEIAEVNGKADEYPLNSQVARSVVIPDVLPGNFKIELRTNNYPGENSIMLLDSDGKIVLHDSFTVANKTTVYPFNLNGCYKLIVKDKGIDGLSWWANTAQGTGSVRLRNANSNAIVKTFNADFGSFFEYNFTTNYALQTGSLAFGNSFNLYPNPAVGKFALEGENLENAQVEVYNVIGHLVATQLAKGVDRVEFSTDQWQPGMYLVSITKGDLKATKKVVVH
jgi:hypothetical protein